MQHGSTCRALVSLLVAMVTVVTGRPADAQDQSRSVIADEYDQRIKPIFESRCIACHSCYNAPCQLNLQSYSGAARGATSRNVYDAERAHSVPPTRVDIDATTPSAWREKGFHDVLGAGDADHSLLLRLTRLRVQLPSLQPSKQAADSQVCLADATGIVDSETVLSMPYGLPPLSSPQIAALQAWIEHGAPGPSSTRPERAAIPEALHDEVQAWEQFLNDPYPRQQLVSRYLYEHLFLASLHFASSMPTTGPVSRPPLFRLVRSRAACDNGIKEIATRRPTDAPGSLKVFYCLRPETGAIVEKTHIPYELSLRKLERIKSQFLGSNWSATRAGDYGDDQANNPFATFAAIPVKARYQFLLDDAWFHIATFIKGTACNGSAAVNSIQEQFFVFFLRPEADSMVMSAEHADAAQGQLVLPGAWGSDITVLQDIPFLKRLVEHREQYRKLRAESVRKLRPNGYSLDDIWDGDGTNPNALLTVFRHDDNAAVVKGAVGDLSKTVFVLDYPLFERLVYNLVVNFDVFGNVGHQVLTRVYMDLIRMEAEELFLSFLPPSQRQRMRRDWYQGSLLTDVKLNYVFPLRNETQPTDIKFRKETSSKSEFVQRAMFERLSAAARGSADSINWRVLQVPESAERAAPLSAPERALRRIASVHALGATPFARFFPELAFVLLRRMDGTARVYSIVHNREHANVSWIMGESLRLRPEQDTLTIREGILGAYPNMFFVLDERQADAFSKAAAGITSRDDYDRLVEQFGVKRSLSQFWEIYDEINAVAQRMEPIERGSFDLTRYELDRR
jgi:Fatty acid cis/trans isomerase (CTI)